VGCSRPQYSTDLCSIPCLNQSTTQKLSKIQSTERLDNDDQWTLTACRLLPLNLHRATEVNDDRHQTGCLMYGRKLNRWRHEYQSQGLLLGFFILFKCSNYNPLVSDVLRCHCLHPVTFCKISWTNDLIQTMLYGLPPAYDRPIASRCSNAALRHVAHRRKQGVLYIWNVVR
jgi:hypothetical protein